MADPVAGYADPFFVEVYDHVVPYRERRDVDFFVQLARESGGPVLELGCGTGRVLIPTARAGIEIVGLDLAPLMLEACRRKLDTLPAADRGRATLVAGDMRGFDLGRTFRLITTPFRPFQHLLTVEDQLACLRCVHRHLEPGGRFVLDVFNPDLRLLADPTTAVESAAEPEFQLPDGRRVVRKHRIVARNLLEQWQDVELVHYVWHLDGREERLVRPLRMRHFFRYEAEHLLARAGLALEAVHTGFDRETRESHETRELILVARKEGRA